MQYPIKPNRRFDERVTEPTAQPQITRRGTPKPVLLVVDDEPNALREIESELRNRYGADYRVKTEASAGSALERLRECEAQGDEVAFVLTDQWMPHMHGTDLLARAREVYPTAKRVLLVDRTDPAVAGPVVEGMALGRIDYYVNKPWGSYDERFHRTVADFLYDWAKDHLPKFEDIRIVGEQLVAAFARAQRPARTQRGSLRFLPGRLPGGPGFAFTIRSRLCAASPGGSLRRAGARRPLQLGDYRRLQGRPLARGEI